jgi:hypothetical protein
MALIEPVKHFASCTRYHQHHAIHKKGSNTMTRYQAIKKIVFLETQAEYYCVNSSKQKRMWLADAHQLRMQQEPPETRKLYQLRSILRNS